MQLLSVRFTLKQIKRKVRAEACGCPVIEIIYLLINYKLCFCCLFCVLLSALDADTRHTILKMNSGQQLQRCVSTTSKTMWVQAEERGFWAGLCYVLSTNTVRCYIWQFLWLKTTFMIHWYRYMIVEYITFESSFSTKTFYNILQRG